MYDHAHAHLAPGDHDGTTNSAEGGAGNDCRWPADPRSRRAHRGGGGRNLVGRVPGVYSQRANWGEGGLLGLALSPHFRRDNWLYAYMSTRNDNRIVRMRYHNGNVGRPHVVLAGIPTSVHHNGGRLVFGPGGLLYASTGDAEDSSRAQNKRSLGGKILRLTPGGDVPRGNPFGNYTWSTPGPTATATSRASPSTTRADCGPASSARRTSTS